MEGEDLPAPGIGLQQVRELGDGTGALVRKRKGTLIGGNGGRESPRILGSLGFHADQGMPLRLGFQDADGLAADIEQVIDLAGQHRELADRDPESRRDVHLALVLNHPAALSKLAVDVLPGSVFRVHRRSWGSPGPRSRSRRETIGTEIQTIRSQRLLHRTPRIRSFLPCTVFSLARVPHGANDLGPTALLPAPTGLQTWL